MTKSTHVKLLSGTLRPDRMKRQPGTNLLTELPPAPPDLSPTALAAWERLGRLAIEARTLSKFDIEVLALAARTSASCELLEHQLSVDGLLIQSGGVTKSHPGVAALDRGRSLLLKLLDALGLSPAGRSRTAVVPPVTAENRFAQL